jgi:hypothetical protein
VPEAHPRCGVAKENWHLSFTFEHLSIKLLIDPSSRGCFAFRVVDVSRRGCFAFRVVDVSRFASRMFRVSRRGCFACVSRTVGLKCGAHRDHSRVRRMGRCHRCSSLRSSSIHLNFMSSPFALLGFYDLLEIR